MSGRNGIAVLTGRARVLRVVPDTITYTVEGADGESVALAGYRKGSSCPVPVSIEVDAAYETWEAALPSDEDRASMKPRAYMSRVNRLELEFRRDMLCAVIPGLEMDAANVLAADGGQWQEILVDLGWIAPTTVSVEDDAGPEATAPADSAPTGAASSHEQPQPTQASIS